MIFTKEQVMAHVRAKLDRHSKSTWPVSMASQAQMEKQILEIALASLEAEAVADVVAWSSPNEERTCDIRLRRHDINPGPLYTTPPAPANAEPVAWLWSNRKHPSEVTLVRPEDDEKAEAAQWSGWSYKALYSEPVTTAYKLPFEHWLSQQTGAIDVECGCVMTEVFFHWLRVAYEAGNSPQCREISNSSTNNFRENAETSTKCWCHTCRPVTFADSRFVVCPECGNKRCPHANDHRNACTGSNEPGQESSAYPAAPQQEVKP